MRFIYSAFVDIFYCGIQAGIDVRLTDLVHFEYGDFMDKEDMVLNSNVIFFNNFGPWFNHDKPELHGHNDKLSVLVCRFCKYTSNLSFY
jgi:hypothetical protein